MTRVGDTGACAGGEFEASSMAGLAALVAFLERACEGAGADAGARSDLRLATEEVFTNILVHGYGGGPGPVTVRVDPAPGQLTVALADRAPVFDPASLPAADTRSGLAGRSAGGLGWHLVRQVMDEVRHAARPGGGNIYTLVRRFAPQPGTSHAG